MEALLTALKPHTTRRRAKKRSVVLHQSEEPGCAYIILKGVVKVYSLSTEGEEQVVGLYDKDNLFPIPWLFGNTKHSLYSYEALTSCTFACIEKEKLLAVLKEKPELQTMLLHYLATVYTGAKVHITALEQSRAREKVLTTLYYLCLSNGREFKPGKFRVELHLTHSIIASLCGITRETTALELGKLKKDGVVRYTARYYLIDKARIEQLLDEDTFSNLKLET